MSYIPANPNLLVNGNFDFWQRGQGSFTASGYHADQMNSNLSGTMSVVRSTVAPVGSRYSWYASTTSTASSFGQVYQPVETLTVIALQGQTVTCSALVQIQATFTGNIQMTALYSAVNDAYGSLSSSIGSGTAVTPSTTTWKLVTYTFVVPSSAVGLRVGVVPTVAQTSNGAVMIVAQMKLELGSNATPFVPENPAKALLRCQRFYEKTYDVDTAPGTVTELGAIRVLAQSASYLYETDMRFKVQKRSPPTMTLYSPNSGASGNLYDFTAPATDRAVSTANIGYCGGLVYQPTGGIWTANHIMEYHWVADSSL